MDAQERIRFVGRHKRAASQIEGYVARLEGYPDLQVVCANLKQGSRRLRSKAEDFQNQAIGAHVLAAVRVDVLSNAIALTGHSPEVEAVDQAVIACCEWLDRAHLQVVPR